MKTFLFLTNAILLVLLPITPSSAQGTYESDQGHTEVKFQWSHAGVSIQSGEFTSAKGSISLQSDSFDDACIKASIDTSSVSSGFAALDDHLKANEYFGVDKYPSITFKSTKIKATGENTMDITGDLTIKDVTRQVVLQAKVTHRGKHPVAAFISYYKGDWIALEATTEINHQAFNVGSFSTGPISITIITEMRKTEAKTVC